MHEKQKALIVVHFCGQARQCVMNKLAHFALVIAVFCLRISLKLVVLSQDHVGSFHISTILSQKSLFVKGNQSENCWSVIIEM